MTESILETAQRLIHGDRNASYGHPRENFKATKDLWQAYLDNIGDRKLVELDVANMMILMKTARVINGKYHQDSYTDIAGYAGTAERLQEEEPAKPAREPRVWQRLRAIPVGVSVTDCDGDRWTRGHMGVKLGEGESMDLLAADFHDIFAPFTEVIA